MLAVRVAILSHYTYHSVACDGLRDDILVLYRDDHIYKYIYNSYWDCLLYNSTYRTTSKKQELFYCGCSIACTIFYKTYCIGTAVYIKYEYIESSTKAPAPLQKETAEPQEISN